MSRHEADRMDRLVDEVNGVLADLAELRRQLNVVASHVIELRQRAAGGEVRLGILEALAPQPADAKWDGRPGGCGGEARQQLEKEPATMDLSWPKRCNRHADCAVADEAARIKGNRATHCHDDCCEDCFGC